MKNSINIFEYNQDKVLRVVEGEICILNKAVVCCRSQARIRFTKSCCVVYEDENVNFLSISSLKIPFKRKSILWGCLLVLCDVSLFKKK